MLQVLLFGAPRVERDGAPVSVQRTKALALLAYLAVTRQPLDREGLLALLWPDLDADGARNNLRRDLSVLRAALGDELLSADRLRVGWNARAGATVDVVAFEGRLDGWRQHAHPDGELCAACAEGLAAAVGLYRDDFLAGFGVPDCPAFEEWQFFQREALRQQLAAATRALSGWHGERGDYDAAIRYARRWLALDTLHEPAQRALMRLYAQAGQLAAALRQYDEAARLLDRELGAEPEPATTELYGQIRARTFPSQGDTRHETRDTRHETRDTRHETQVSISPSPPLASPPLASPPLASPPLASPPLALSPSLAAPPAAGFVGRARELADVIRRLTDPHCRMLTLVGPGGIGKTRLALEAARTLADTWAGDDEIADGGLFVPLTAVSAASGLFSALAAAAGFEFYANAPQRQQVLDFFRAKRMLVVLDNFEQLVDEAGFVGELLAAAPGVRLLVTSRVALNLRDEWFHPLDGLSFPADDAGGGLAQLARFDAVRLFEQHARRVRGDFSLARERAAVVRLCQLVEGAPLAIELAASWLKVLTVDQVVEALTQGLDLLTTTSKDVPLRHRSMRTVLEESWRLLSEEEQPILACLAVFAGGFSAAAAQAVAGASLAALAALADKSLLRGVAGGRFQMHELLRQFAAEKLASSPALGESAAARHSAYYLGFVAEREPRLHGVGSKAAVAEVAGEAANVRVAWGRAVERGDVAGVDKSLLGYFGYYYGRNDYLGGAEAFEHALSIGGGGTTEGHLLHRRVLARSRIRYGTFIVFLGNYAAAVQELERGLADALALDMRSDVALAHTMLGAVARWRGDVVTAQGSLDQALAIGRSLGDTVVIAQALQLLAGIASTRGDYAESDRLGQESLAFSRLAARDDLTVDSLATLAWSTVCRGEYAAAEAYYRESLALAEKAGDDIGLSRAHGGIGWIAWCIGGSRVAEAREQLERSIVIERRLGVRLWVANYLGDLALVAIDEGAFDQAWAYAQEGLALAREVDSPIYIVYHLGLLGRTAVARGELALAGRYLREALRMASEAELWSQLALSMLHTSAALVALGRTARALELLAALERHPAAWHAIQTRARRRIAELAPALPAEEAQAAVARGRELDWQASVAAALDDLALACA